MRLKLILVFVMFQSGLLFAQSKINQADVSGKKDGFWKGTYEVSHRPRYEGIFEHGKEVGMFYFYDDTQSKTIIATREFNAKDNSAYTIFYNQNKFIVSEGKVINKLFEGSWKYYHENSKIVMTIENYSKGKLEGVRSVFYLNGKIAEEMNYKNNLKEGIYKKYTEEGIILEESNYKNNNYNGLATFKEADGAIASKGQFINGKKTGVWQFYEKGKLAKEVNMSNPKSVSKAKLN